MNINKDIVKSKAFQEFFNDPNVYFPDNPKLIPNISTYEAPHGLGLQFRGGPKKLIIKGKNTSLIWQDLGDMINGEHHLGEIISKGVKKGIDVIDLCNFFKILHTHHLFERKEVSTPDQDYSDANQINFYNRLVGITGFNDEGKDIYDRVKQTKVLLVCNSEFINSLVFDLKISGFNNFGVLFINQNKQKINQSLFNEKELMTFKDVTQLNNENFNDLLATKINDYNVVVSALNNPSEEFLKNLTIFCSNSKKNLLPINLRANTYEVGPFFTPKVSACPNCYTLRNQSHDQNSAYEFVYQNNLKEKGVQSDNNITGYDNPSFRIATNIAISEIQRYYTDFSKSILTNKVFELDTINYQVSYNNLIRVFNCFSCS